MGNIQTVSLLLSDFCDSLQLRGFIDGIQSLRGYYVSKTKLFNCCLYLGLLENNLILKQSFAKTSWNPQKEFLQESRTFQRGNLPVRLKFFQLGQKNSEYGYKYSIRMHDLRHTFKWCPRTRIICVRWFVAPSGKGRKIDEKEQITSVQWSHLLAVLQNDHTTAITTFWQQTRWLNACQSKVNEARFKPLVQRASSNSSFTKQTTLFVDKMIWRKRYVYKRATSFYW